MVVVVVDKQVRITLWSGNIATIRSDVIVNAANRSLLGGGGVDGVIHNAAGPELLTACKPLGGCETGQAKATPAFHLAARYVIHTVGPIWRDGNEEEKQLLADCYENVLGLAAKLDCRSIAFPALSTGAYGFPLDVAARIAIGTVSEALKRFPQLQVTFVSFPARHQKHLRSAAKSLGVACSLKS